MRSRTSNVVASPMQIGRGRRRTSSLSHADRAAPLGADDLELLASRGPHGRSRGRVGAPARARAPASTSRTANAARRALRVLAQSQPDAAGRDGARHRVARPRAAAARTRARRDCVERGYVLMLSGVRHEIEGDYEAANVTAAEAAAIGERFGDADLHALALHAQGNVLIRSGRIDEGLALLDEAMVAVTAGELSPVLTGLVYCSVIEGCHEVYAIGRAQEWTSALTQWCEQQPDMVAFTGRCLAHRAEIMQLHGEWGAALEEARRAARAIRAGDEPGRRRRRALPPRGAAPAAGRVRGRRARPTGRRASAGWSRTRGWRCCGWLRARATSRPPGSAACSGETTDPLRRVRLLPAYVEIMLAGGDVERAADAWRELDRDRCPATTARCCGRWSPTPRERWRSRKATRTPRSPPCARPDSRGTSTGRRTRPRASGCCVGLACRALGDEESALLELEAAARGVRGAGSRAGPGAPRSDVPRAAGRTA